MPPSPVISRYETRRSFRPHHVVQSQNTGIGLCADGYLDLLDEFQLGPPGERGDADGTRRMGTTTVILRGICSVGFSRFQTTQVLLHRSISKSELHWSLTLPRLPLCTHYLQPHLMPEAPFQGQTIRPTPFDRYLASAWHSSVTPSGAQGKPPPSALSSYPPRTPLSLGIQVLRG
jgi:hypothetical protein